MVNTQALRALKGKNGGQIATSSEKRDLTREKLVHGRVIAVDPSLSNTGVIELAHDERGLRVLHAKTLRPEAHPELKGFMKDTAEAFHLRALLDSWYADAMWESEYDAFRDPYMEPYAVREAPPIGGTFAHPESSIQAGLMFEVWASGEGLPILPMVYTQGHRALICEGKAPKLKKSEYHSRYLAPMAEKLGIEGMEKIINPDLRDALAVGLTALSRGLK